MRAWIVAGLLAVSAPAAAAAAPLFAGAYENTLLIGFDPATGVVTGYFDMEQEGPPAMSCIFYLKGRLAGGAAQVDTYDPADPAGDRIRGRVAVTGARKVVVSLPQEHGGCGNVWQFADASQPAEFTLEGEHTWTSIRVVKAAKAYFYPSPNATAHGRAYIVHYDGVGVRTTEPGWVQVDYTGGAHVISGWMREGDLYPK